MSGQCALKRVRPQIPVHLARKSIEKGLLNIRSKCRTAGSAWLGSAYRTCKLVRTLNSATSPWLPLTSLSPVSVLGDEEGPWKSEHCCAGEGRGAASDGSCNDKRRREAHRCVTSSAPSQVTPVQPQWGVARLHVETAAPYDESALRKAQRASASTGSRGAAERAG